jgi:hypothetical protein
VSNTNDFSEDILKGQRPDMPDDAHPELVALINQCWLEDPDQRPTMDDVIVTLETIRDALVNNRTNAALSSSSSSSSSSVRDERNVEEWPEDATRQLTERKKQISDLVTKQRSLTVHHSLNHFHLIVHCHSFILSSLCGVLPITERIVQRASWSC